MRLRDAITTMAGIEGVRPHRSWWVAADAIVALGRVKGRSVLTLASGFRVPVSREARQLLGPDFRRPAANDPLTRW
jgi:DNA-binding LytR/AlgR family response regulator